jgi:hydroxymethylpyrimidine pyrophosphatase-like HAD family hydrolase
MQKKIWLFADVDASLITVGRSSPEAGSEAVAHNRHGQPVGWLTPKQRLFLDMVKEGCQVVPTTARTTGGLARLKLGLDGYAICTFGGIILDQDGKVEPRWLARLQGEARKDKRILAEIADFTRRFAGLDDLDVRVEIASDAGMELYVSVKHNSQNRRELKQLSEMVRGVLFRDWKIHLNGNFLAVLPPYLSKAYALEWFKQNMMDEGALAIGLGDSKTDLEFMHACDLAIMPTDSQNFKTLLWGEH